MHQRETDSNQPLFNFTDDSFLDTVDPSTNTFVGQFNVGNDVSSDSRVNDVNLVNSRAHRDHRNPPPQPNLIPKDPCFPVDVPWSIYQPPRNDMVPRVQPGPFHIRNNEWNSLATQPTIHVHQEQAEMTYPHVVHSNISHATPHSIISHQDVRERRSAHDIDNVVTNSIPLHPSGFPIANVEAGHHPNPGMFRNTFSEACSVPSRHVAHPVYDSNIVHNTNVRNTNIVRNTNVRNANIVRNTNVRKTNVRNANIVRNPNSRNTNVVRNANVHNTNVVQRVNRQVVGRNRTQGNTRRTNQDITKYIKELPPQGILDENFDKLVGLGEATFKKLLNKVCDGDSPITLPSNPTKTIQLHKNQSKVQACKPEDQTTSKSHDITPQVSDKRSNQQDKQQDSKGSEDGSVPTKGGKRKPRTYAHAVPSQHCHICSRKPTAESPHVCCGNLIYGRCRKTVCKRCFSQFNWDITEAINAAPGSWKCPHCRDECPSRAQCVIYNRTSDRRRQKTLDGRKRKVEAGPSGVNEPASKRQQCGSNAPDPAAKEAGAVDTPGQAQNDGEPVMTRVQTEGTEPTCRTVSQAAETHFLSGTNSSAKTPENVETSVCHDQQQDCTITPIPVSAENMINTLKGSSHIVGTTEQKEMLRNIMENRMETHCGLVESDTDMFPGASPEVDEGGQFWNTPDELSTYSAYGTYSSNQNDVSNNTPSEEKEGMTDATFVHPMLLGVDSSLESDCLVSNMGNETEWDEGVHDILDKQSDIREDCEWISDWLNDDPDVLEGAHEFNHDSFSE